MAADEESDSDFEAAPTRRTAAARTPATVAAASSKQQPSSRRTPGSRAAGAGQARQGRAEAHWSEAEVEAALQELAQQEQALSALQASINQAALEEDAAAEVKLAAAGQQLDGLADSLQALESRQATLQVRLAAGVRLLAASGLCCLCYFTITVSQKARLVTTSCHLAPPVLPCCCLASPPCPGRPIATAASTLP